MKIVNLNFVAEQAAQVLRQAGCKTLITKEIQWASNCPSNCRPIFIATLYVVLPDGSIKKANDFLSDEMKLKIFKLLKKAS